MTKVKKPLYVGIMHTSHIIIISAYSKLAAICGYLQGLDNSTWYYSAPWHDSPAIDSW